MALGFGLGLGLQRGKPNAAALAPFSPILEWDDTFTGSGLRFNVLLPSGNGAPHDAAVGDVLRVRYVLASGGTPATYLTDTLDAGEVAGGDITDTGISQPAAGDYLFDIRIERGLLLSTWSASIPVTVPSFDTLPHFAIIFN